MNANEQRTFNKLKQRIYSTTREFYSQANIRLSLQERLLIDYFAGTYAAELMKALREVNTHND